jgi:hypothetical protein
MHGVSDKAIRDIWNGRTWRSETKHLDLEENYVPPEILALSTLRNKPYEEPQIGKKRGRDPDQSYDQLLVATALNLLANLSQIGLTQI